MSSTPDICCSMGVATDCSTVRASDPVYVVWTWISGGTMLGNWAMGSLDMATRPRMTMRMAITIATIGRLIKNLDIAGYLFSAGWATGFVSGLTTGAGAAAFSSGLPGVVDAAWAFGENGFGVTSIPG